MIMRTLPRLILLLFVGCSTSDSRPTIVTSADRMQSVSYSVHLSTRTPSGEYEHCGGVGSGGPISYEARRVDYIDSPIEIKIRATHLGIRSATLDIFCHG